jgi:hypothetical protein
MPKIIRVIRKDGPADEYIEDAKTSYNLKVQYGGLAIQRITQYSTELVVYYPNHNILSARVFE